MVLLSNPYKHEHHTDLHLVWMQLARQAVGNVPDDMHSRETVAEEVVSDNNAFPTEQPGPDHRPTPAADAADKAAASGTLLHSDTLKHSETLPSSLSDPDQPIFVPPKQDSIPAKPPALQTRLSDIPIQPEINNADEVPMPENPYEMHLSSSGAAELKHDVLAGLHSAYSLTAVSAAHMIPLSTVSGAGIADSSMSNSPKESSASIVCANPFQTRTNTEGGTDPRSTFRGDHTSPKLGSGGEVGRGSSPSNKKFGGVSQAADGKENFSAAAAAKPGSSYYNPRASQGSVSMTGSGSMRPPPSVPVPGSGYGQQVVGHSGTASALSGTASDHALSATNGMSERCKHNDCQGWDVSHANMHERGTRADSTIQGHLRTEGPLDPVEATASKRAKLTHDSP